MLRAISRVALAAILGVLMPVALAIPVLAASPMVQVGVSASPSPNVSPGKAVLFVVDVTYSGSSTVNHVDAASSASSGTFLKSWVDGVPCDAQSCSLGSFAGGSDSATLLFIYRAGASGSVTDTVTVTTGEGSNDSSNASHTDTFYGYSDPIGVETDINLGVATLLPDALFPGFDLGTVDTGLDGLGSGNPHGTQLTFPGAAAQGTLATIKDVKAEDSPCPATFKSAAKCFGGGSDLSVLFGADVSPYLKVTVAWSAGELRKGVSEKTIQIVHIFRPPGTNADTVQVISNICSLPTPAATELPCRTAGRLSTDGTGTVLVTLYLKHNGLIKGW